MEVGQMITLAAYFHVCSCERHGHVCFADGTRGPQVCDKESALAEMEMALKAGLIIKEEAVLLRDQIRRSALVGSPQDVDPRWAVIMELRNLADCQELMEDVASDATVAPDQSESVH